MPDDSWNFEKPVHDANLSLPKPESSENRRKWPVSNLKVAVVGTRKVIPSMRTMSSNVDGSEVVEWFPLPVGPSATASQKRAAQWNLLDLQLHISHTD